MPSKPLRHVIVRAARVRGGLEPLANKLATRLGIPESTMQRTLKRIAYDEVERVDLYTADRIATALVGHPSAVYGDEWWDEINAWPDVDAEIDDSL